MSLDPFIVCLYRLAILSRFDIMLLGRIPNHLLLLLVVIRLSSLLEHVRIYLNTPEARVIRLGEVVLESSEVNKDLLEGGPGRNK